MCRLVAISYRHANKVRHMDALMRAGLLENQPDGWGISDGLTIQKGLAYIDAPKNTLNPDRIWIGHLRKASKGSVQYKNAHPFNFPTFVGAHNGTMNGGPSFRVQDASETDSWRLFNLFNAHGAQADVLTFAKTLDAFDASSMYVLYFLEKSDRLHIIRGPGRFQYELPIFDGHVYATSYDVLRWYLKDLVAFGDVTEDEARMFTTSIMPIGFSINNAASWLTVEYGKPTKFTPVYVNMVQPATPQQKPWYRKWF